MLKSELEKVNSTLYPFHMPGHKRNENYLNFPNPATIDITEIDGLDNLHCARGVIKNIEDRISIKCKADNCILSVNGSSCSILSAIIGSTNKGDKIIISRLCHKSVYNACFLNELNVSYVIPEYNDEFGFFTSINPKGVETALNSNLDAKLVVITSPTYEGSVSNIKAISEICHKYGVPLFVDEAHGAHFSYSSIFPKSAIELGADIVCQSYHKTLPCLTQTGVLLTKGKLANVSKIQKYMSIFESSSPSYVLMSSIENALNLTDDDFVNYDKLILEFYRKTKLHKLKFYIGENSFDFDKSKIIISTKSTNISGVELADILRKKYKLECEMSSKNYIILMTSVADTKEGLDMLSSALLKIDFDLKIKDCYKSKLPVLPTKAKCSFEVNNVESCSFSNSQNKICGEYVFAYPPGIPILVPGEIISKEIICQINDLINNGVNMISESMDLPDSINIDKG